MRKIIRVIFALLIFILLLTFAACGGQTLGVPSPAPFFTESAHPSSSESSPIPKPEAVRKESATAQVRAMLENNTVTLLFDEEAVVGYFGDYWSAFGLKYNSPYIATGFNGSYTDVFIADIGQEVYPYVVLLTEKGMVEYLDVWDGIENGCHFANNGEIQGLKDIIYFREGAVPYEETGDGSVGGYMTIYAVDRDEREYDITNFWGSGADGDDMTEAGAEYVTDTEQLLGIWTYSAPTEEVSEVLLIFYGENEMELSYVWREKEGESGEGIGPKLFEGMYLIGSISPWDDAPAGKVKFFMDKGSGGENGTLTGDYILQRQSETLLITYLAGDPLFDGMEPNLSYVFTLGDYSG